MVQPIDPELKGILLSTVFRPAVTSWNRLEGRPRREDFDRSLRAEIRDPLWMVCRQWQFGEFLGEDTGSAIKAKTQVTTTRLNRYAGRSQKAVGYNDALPLETRVEREPVAFDLMTRAQMGGHWFKLLEEVGDFEALYLTRFGFTDPDTKSEEEAQLRSDRKAWQTLAALKGRVVDGQKLHKAIRSEENEHENWLVGVVPDLADRQKILEATEAFEAWFGRVYSQPDEMDDPAWSDAYLEYLFACAAPADNTGEKQTVLVAEQYHQGHLDWYSVDVDDSLNARLTDKPGAIIPEGEMVLEEPISFILNPIEFGGMPNVRWWEFEDRKTDFGNMNPSTSDLPSLILAEFGLIYGNDWSLVPYVQEIGTLGDVQGVVVTDVFGVRTLIQPAADMAGDERKRWGMYYLNTTEGDRIDTRLFLSPTVGKIQESAPLERVILARDEMANMVWGIEEVIPSCVRGGANGYEAATDLESYFLAQAPPSPEPRVIDTGAAIQYKLGTRVPENWIPFIPVHNPGSNREIRLQRAAMPRLIPGALEEYDLRLISVAASDDLVDEGRSLVIVALVGTDLHIRIFDASGEKVVDKRENELESGEMLAALKQRLNPFPDESSLSQEDKQEIIRNATSIAGHTPPEKPVEPRGAVLRSGLDEDPPQPYFLNEEEVSRVAEMVTRTYQRVRWWDGKVYTWLGRRKQTGRGQGSRSLEFDRIVPVDR